MSGVVLRIGAVASVQEDADAHMRHLACVASPEELGEWTREFERGGFVLVHIRLYADTADEHGVTRHHDGDVDALTFMRPHCDDNVQHAREMVHSSIDALVATLQHDGVETTSNSLLDAPLDVELDATLQHALA